MRQPLPHILNMAVGRPLCIQPERLSIILRVLQQDRFSIEPPAISGAAPARGKQKPYVQTAGGTAILPVSGLLMKRTGMTEQPSPRDTMRCLPSSSTSPPAKRAP